MPIWIRKQPLFDLLQLVYNGAAAVYAVNADSPAFAWFFIGAAVLSVGGYILGVLTERENDKQDAEVEKRHSDQLKKLEGIEARLTQITVAPAIGDRANDPPRAERPDPQQIRFVREKLRLSDLVNERQQVITGKTFRDCVIEGPAVIFLRRDVTLDTCSFNADVEELFIPVQVGRKYFGLIGIDNTTFIGCEFRGIGVIAASDQIEQFKRGFNR